MTGDLDFRPGPPHRSTFLLERRGLLYGAPLPAHRLSGRRRWDPHQPRSFAWLTHAGVCQVTSRPGSPSRTRPGAVATRYNSVNELLACRLRITASVPHSFMRRISGTRVLRENPSSSSSTPVGDGEDAPSCQNRR